MTEYLKKGLLLLVLFIFFIYSLININKEAIIEDEPLFIDKTKIFDLVFLQHNFNSPFWNGFHRYDQPYLPAFYYGLICHLSGIKDINIKLQKLNFNLLLPNWNWEGNQKNIMLKQLEQPLSITQELKNKFDLVVTLRRGAVILFIVCGYLFYLILYQVLNFPLSLLGLIIFFINPLSYEFGRKVLGDQLLLIFLLTTPLLLFHLVKIKSKKKYIRDVILIGINCGLALSSKLNGALVYLFYLLFSIFYILIKIRSKNNQWLRWWFFGPLLVAVITSVVFFIIHPTLWRNPIVNFQNFIYYRLQTVKIQTQIWPNDTLNRWPEKFIAFSQNLFYLPLKLDLWLFLFGLITLCLKTSQNWRLVLFKPKGILLMWTLFLLISGYIYIPLRWPRYYWIFVPNVIFFQLFSLKYIYDMIRKKFRRLTNNKIFI